MPRRDQRLLLGLAALTLLFALVQSATGISGDVLLAPPVLSLLHPLLAGRYVGEDGLARLTAALAPLRRRAAVMRLAPAPRAPRVLARGGRPDRVALPPPGGPPGPPPPPRPPRRPRPQRPPGQSQLPLGRRARRPQGPRPASAGAKSRRPPRVAERDGQ